MDYREVIEQGKSEFLANSWSFIFWGLIGSLIPFLILWLKYLKVYEDYADYLLLGFPLAGIFSTFFICRHALKNRSKNLMTMALSFLWGFVSVNVVVIAFGVPLLYGKLLIATVFLMLAIAQSTCGFLIQIPILLFSGIGMAFLVWGYLFFLAWNKGWEHYFLVENLDMALLILLSFFGQLIPGFLIRKHQFSLRNS